MAKKRRQRPALTDPFDILAAATGRPLVSNEVANLQAHIDGLEAKLHATEEALARLQSSHRETVNTRLLGLGLDHDGALLLQFPDQHTVRIPVGLLQADNALAMAALLRVLRDRQHQLADKFVGTNAAPTQHSLQAILESMKGNVAVTHCRPKGYKPAPAELSLRDLDLDLDLGLDHGPGRLIP